jgi:hypothetical protein
VSAGYDERGWQVFLRALDAAPWARARGLDRAAVHEAPLPAKLRRLDVDMLATSVHPAGGQAVVVVGFAPAGWTEGDQARAQAAAVLAVRRAMADGLAPVGTWELAGAVWHFDNGEGGIGSRVYGRLGELIADRLAADFIGGLFRW